MYMIYQLYFKDDHNIQPFSELYQKIDLSVIKEKKYLPSTNMEYTAMCYYWLNPDSYSWIGFTSCRQIIKGFQSTIKDSCIIDNLKNYDIITWGLLYNYDKIFCHKSIAKNIFDQSEIYIPGIMQRMIKVFNVFNESGAELKDIFKSVTKAIFCNYWIMNKHNFTDFMAWSYPMCVYMTKHPTIYCSNNTHYDYIGHIIERLFIYWYLKNNKTFYVLS